LPLNFPKLLSLILFSFLILPCWAEEYELELAGYYYQQGFYQEAITEYLRIIFLNPSAGNLDAIYYNIALCYCQLSDWAKAEQSIKKAIAHAADANQKQEYTFIYLEILIARKLYRRAEKELQCIYEISPVPEYRLRSLYLLGVIYIYTYNWKQAQASFSEYFNTSPTYSENQKQKILTLLAAAQKLPYKSKEWAFFLSMLLPGAGQAYAGDFVQGANALAVNGSAGTLLVLTILDGYYLDAGVIFLFVFERYYLGNLYHAKRLAGEYNERINTDMAGQIFNLLLEKGE
jgi:tetratricopeptide (TPR) repeat protein